MIRSILIIRLSAIGDIVMASGVLPALRNTYPQARIDWLVKGECSELLQATSHLNRILKLPNRGWRGKVRALEWAFLFREGRELVRTLRLSRYDLVLDMQGLLKSGIWAWLTRAKNRVGLDSREGSANLMSRVVNSPCNDKNICSEYKALLQDLGIHVSSYRLGLETGPADEQWSHALLRTLFPDRSHQPYIVFCPFTTRPQKHWPEKSWIRLALTTGLQLELPILILGGPGDRDPGERIQEAGSDFVHNLAGRTTLRQSLALIQEAALVIGVDTGLTHMGVMSNVPTVALFGSTCPYLVTDNPRARVLYDSLSCSPCKRNPTCNGRYDCMQALSVDRVLEAAFDVLEEPCVSCT